MGYAGGMKKDPTYKDLGDHTETIQIDYDPSVISYSELVRVFWQSHDATQPSWSRQYMSIIFFHNREQQKIAMETRDLEARTRGRKVQTAITPYKMFYLAEDYHQKYRLKMHADILEEYRSFYPDSEDITNSTSAARVNGYLAGEGDLGQLDREGPLLGISENTISRIRKTLSQYQQH